MSRSSHPMYQDPFELDILQSPGVYTMAIEYTFQATKTQNKSRVKLNENFPLLAMASNPKHLTV
ncbi:hypothetical protein BDV29DRAFT_176077 [Aspergillus leporis]|uniref:Uncharacterized protein n=1 Tax=Aspergillus leporis TaxID=41062 RepID=A0A5N5X0T4_9EURO|nr:hypothetical protein BDV29DRAFT_176077 [Aspergillus leporis]